MTAGRFVPGLRNLCSTVKKQYSSWMKNFISNEPFEYPKSESYAIAPSETTRLGQAISEWREGHPGTRLDLNSEWLA